MKKLNSTVKTTHTLDQIQFHIALMVSQSKNHIYIFHYTMKAHKPRVKIFVHIKKKKVS